MTPRSWWRKKRRLTVLLIGISVAVCSGCKTEGRKHHNFVSKLFRFKDGIWTPSPAVPNGFGVYDVSSRGTVWVADWPGGLSRLDGDSWTHYGKTEFGTTSDWMRAGFVLRGEEAWGATKEGVLRYDGKSWSIYKDALQSDWPTDIVAGRSGIWVIDFHGNLSRFDGDHWTIRNLKVISSEPPPDGWSYWLDADYPPRLVMTGDGRLWVWWHGLWIEDGEEWRSIRLEGIDIRQAVPIGHDANRVWMWFPRAGEMIGVTADGVVGTRYGRRELGLSGNGNVSALVASNGRMLLATNTGLAAFDGRTWQRKGWPEDFRWLVGVALAPDGSAWVKGMKEVP